MYQILFFVAQCSKQKEVEEQGKKVHSTKKNQHLITNVFRFFFNKGEVAENKMVGGDDDDDQEEPSGPPPKSALLSPSIPPDEPLTVPVAANPQQQPPQRHVKDEETQTNLNQCIRCGGFSVMMVSLLFATPILSLLSGLSCFSHWRLQIALYGHETDSWITTLVQVYSFFVICGFVVGNTIVIPLILQGLCFSGCGKTQENLCTYRCMAAFVIFSLPQAFCEICLFLSDLRRSDHNVASSALALIVDVFSLGVCWYGYASFIADMLHRATRTEADQYLSATHAKLSRRPGCELPPHERRVRRNKNIAELLHVQRSISEPPFT